MTIRELLDHVDFQINTYFNPHIKDEIDSLNLVLAELDVAQLSDTMTVNAILFDEKVARILVSEINSGCMTGNEEYNFIEIPMEILDSADPVIAARKWKIDEITKVALNAVDAIIEQLAIAEQKVVAALENKNKLVDNE